MSYYVKMFTTVFGMQQFFAAQELLLINSEQRTIIKIKPLLGTTIIPGSGLYSGDKTKH